MKVNQLTVGIEVTYVNLCKSLSQNNLNLWVKTKPVMVGATQLCTCWGSVTDTEYVN